MRVAADDFIRTPYTAFVAYLMANALMGAIFASPLPLKRTKNPKERNFTVESSTIQQQPENRPGVFNLYNLRVSVVCDDTSSEFCNVNATGCAILKHFKDDLDYGSGFFNGCNNGTTCEMAVEDPHRETLDYQVHGFGVVLTKRLFSNASLRLNVTFCVTKSRSLREKILAIDSCATSEAIDVIVAIGDVSTVQTAVIVAEGQGLPSLGYITEYGHGQKFIQGDNFVQLNPSPEAQGKALTQIIGQFNMKQTAVIVEDTRMADGFLFGVRHAINVRSQDVFNVVPMDKMIQNKALFLKLTELSNVGLKVFVLHCSPELMLKVVKAALTTRLYNTGHAWFLSEMAFSRDPEIIAQLPEGLLAIDNFWLGGLPDAIVSFLDNVLTATSYVTNNIYISTDSMVSLHQAPPVLAENGTAVLEGFRDIHNFPSSFKRYLQTVVDCCTNHSDHFEEDKAENSFDDKRSEYIGGRNVEEFFDGTNPNQGAAFYLLNTVEDGTGTRMWAKVGYVASSGRRDLKTVLWPGHNIYGPSSSTVRTYRVVTRPAEPFVFVGDQVWRKEECFGDVPCLKVENSSHSLLAAVVDDFQSEMKSIGQLYTVHCCKGLTLEMLNTLAQNLNFRYVVYFVNDTNYGTVKDGNWTGMVGDVIDGTADIIAGAFSMTSERMAVLDFTEPYYQNEYALVTGEDAHYVSIWAFMSPFSGQVWLCIMVSSIVAGIATAFLEWRSPFGLNPRGRKRTKNYGLGSGLLMVMVLLTGHTINIKAPKSWPGKVIQNVWAGLAIFIMTSYTANLAAYLAGQSAVSSVKNVFDPELLTKRVAVMKSSAVENYLSKINPSLSKRAKINYVTSTVMAINKLRSTAEIGPQYTEDRTIDVYLDDSPLLQYGLVKNDKDCRIRFAGKGFGADGYAFGLSRHSWLKIPMSNEIMKYTQSEKFHELGKKYLSRPQCEHFLSGTANPYGLEHTGGLFIILSSAILIAVLFLILEHLAYHFVVPWLRKQPAESFWKTENLAFISQRVFRVVRSERLYSQKQAAQEMISIVRQRDFTRIIQKNELQKRRATAQRRVKSKAEVFQEITANIVSYHRQLQSASETADNSEAEIDFEGLQDYGDEGLQDYGDEGSRSDLDGATSGVNNDAYDATDSSDAAMNRFHLRRASSVSNDMTRVSSDEAVFQRDSGHFQDVSDNNVGRKVSSRSLGYGISSDFSPRFRKRSDSYFVFPSVSKCKERTMSDANNRASGHIEQRQVHKQTDLDKKKDSILKLSTDHSELMDAHIMTTPPPDSKGSVYYNSPSSSSGRSPSEENREFSPLPSLTSPSIDDFPDCRELSGSFSPLPPNSSPSLMSADPDFPANNEPGIASELAHSNKAANVSPEPAQLKDSPTKIGLHSFNQLPRREPRNNELPRSASVDSVPLSLVSVPNNDILVSSFTPSEPEENRAAAEISKLPNVKPEAQGNCNKKKIPAKPLRKFSSGHSPENTGQCQVSKNNKKKPMFDNQGRDYFQRNLKLKDNRVKSTLRQHAMSGYQSHLPADLIDDCTLEALSKEDVLILWRKSEIDLESRLQEVLAKNRRLSLAIDYLTRQEFSGEPEEV